jgi:hypothetical protein
LRRFGWIGLAVFMVTGCERSLSRFRILFKKNAGLEARRWRVQLFMAVIFGTFDLPPVSRTSR